MRRLLLATTLLAFGCGEVHNPSGGGGAVVPDCRIEADGLLSADEVPAAAGLSALYGRNAPGEPASGPEEADGVVDFSSGPEDIGALFTLDAAGEGIRGRFDGAEWTAPLSVESPALRGVYRRTSEGVELLGGVSDEGVDPAQRIEFRYEPPLLVLPLPLGVGDRWGGQVAFRDAVFAGLPNAGVEDWSFEAVSLGAAQLSGGISVEEVLRVEVSVQRTLAVAPGGTASSSAQTLWLAPCFGEVGRLVDGGDEYRRLLLD